METFKNLLFAKINSLPLLDKRKATDEVLKLDLENSFWDEYRHTRMFPLMTKNASLGSKGVNNKQQGEFRWTAFAPPTIVKWCEDHVFPWLGEKTRVMALLTEPGASNNEHIDCAPSELNSLQHKFRVVLQGKTDTLYWLTSEGKVYAPDIEEAFIMDGGWPHGMSNTNNEIKVTIALGAPWNGKDDYGSDLTILQHRNEYKMPDDINHLWDHKKYI